ncbi:chemotaxis protein [Leptolyngbya sp. Heron Island J]|uniref:response regulator n=1 Tax=Leptolyngbya sp. Heron Island J TaxID=1385935 RepID=UPI0003B9D5D3|nr:response regulator [Leptolyngbya sp. Heron Island J]ESA34202.1 chemotaxis protein [Leptolyngbya sp. Heron Island J]
MAKSLFQTTRHILVITPVEDMEVILRLSLELIANAHISTVSTITQAIGIATVYQPDLLLLDTDVIQEYQLFVLRSVPVLRQTPMIFLVPRVRTSDRQQSERLGINSILAKPFDPSELIKQVNISLRCASISPLMATSNA